MAAAKEHAMEAIAFLLIDLLLLQVANTEFIVQPQDQDEVVGVHTLFRCLYDTSNNSDLSNHLGWLVNNKSTNSNPNSCTCNQTARSEEGMFENMTITSTLCITATIKCNETYVQCIVAIGTGNESTFVRSKVATLYVQTLLTLEKASLTEFDNGTILIMWDPIMVGGENTMLRYEINIIGSNSSNNLLTQNVIPSVPYSYPFDPGNLNSTCEALRVSITPIINDHYPAGPTILTQDIPPVQSITPGGVSFFNNSLAYVFVLPDFIFFCFLTVEATNKVSNNSYPIMRERTNSRLTNMIRFIVEDMELPFDEDYTANVTLRNQYSAQSVNMSIDISTHDIQDISSNVTHLTVSFVQNSQAQGALIIFISDGTCSYNYTVANKTGDSILISQQINNSTDSVFAFDIEANGLLKNVTSLRPAVRLDHDRQPCITTCDSEPSFVRTDSLTISTNIFIEDDLVYMIFECNVSEADSDLQGCIILTHDREDHSILHVDAIEKENPVLKLKVESGSKYSFAVFDWWMTTGMIRSNTLLKGTLCVNVSAYVAGPTESEETVTSDSNETTTTVTADRGPKLEYLALLILVPVLVAVIVTIIIITLEKKKRCQLVAIEQQDDQDVGSELKLKENSLKKT